MPAQPAPERITAMTTGPGQPRRAAPGEAARQHLTAIASSLTRHGLAGRLTRLAGTPVLTINDPAAGPGTATITIDPDLRTSTGLPLDCTCLWTPAPGDPPEATAAAIRTILATLRPAAGGPGPGPDTPA
jgi:hypothetical protein